jgi:hypothetical protein
MAPIGTLIAKAALRKQPEVVARSVPATGRLSGSDARKRVRSSALAWARRMPRGLDRSPPNLSKPGAFLFSGALQFSNHCPIAPPWLELTVPVRRDTALVPLAVLQSL